jgi:hypothetical protein
VKKFFVKIQRNLEWRKNAKFYLPSPERDPEEGILLMVVRYSRPGTASKKRKINIIFHLYGTESVLSSRNNKG